MTNEFKVKQYDYLVQRIDIYIEALNIASRELEYYTKQDAEEINDNLIEQARKRLYEI